MTSIAESSEYFRQVIRNKMAVMLTNINYYRKVCFEQIRSVTLFIFRLIQQGFWLGYYTMRAFLKDSYTIAKWLLINLPYYFVEFCSAFFHHLWDFGRDLCTIIRPCIKWLAETCLKAFWKTIGMCLGAIMAIGDLAVDALKFIWNCTFGVLFASKIDTQPLMNMQNTVVTGNAYHSLGALTTENIYTPAYQSTHQQQELSFSAPLSEKRALMAP